MFDQNRRFSVFSEKIKTKDVSVTQNRRAAVAGSRWWWETTSSVRIQIGPQRRELAAGPLKDCTHASICYINFLFFDSFQHGWSEVDGVRSLVKGSLSGIAHLFYITTTGWTERAAPTNSNVEPPQSNLILAQIYRKFVFFEHF